MIRVGVSERVALCGCISASSLRKDDMIKLTVQHTFLTSVTSRCLVCAASRAQPDRGGPGALQQRCTQALHAAASSQSVIDAAATRTCCSSHAAVYATVCCHTGHTGCSPTRATLSAIAASDVQVRNKYWHWHSTDIPNRTTNVMRGYLQKTLWCHGLDKA
jgi:hypothetical protein